MPGKGKVNLEERKQRYYQEAELHSRIHNNILYVKDGKIQQNPDEQVLLAPDDQDQVETFDKMQQDLADIREGQREEFVEQHQEYINSDHESNEGDYNRLTDKVILNLFSSEILKKNYNDAAYNEKEMTALMKELEREDLEDVRDKFPKNEDLLERILKDVKAYSDMTDDLPRFLVSQEVPREKKRFESRILRRIYRRLSALYEQMNQQNEKVNLTHEGEFVDDDSMFTVANLMNYFQAELFGKLDLIPEQSEQENFIHLSLVGHYMGVKDRENKIKPTTSDDILMQTDFRDSPLFPHQPSPQDVYQGNLGDCYFVSTLAEIAAKHPEKIKEMMRDNRNGTVTVRFYHRVRSGNKNAFEPFYVTVDKAYSQGQAQKSLWVQTMERALAVSGMGVEYKRLHDKGIECWRESSPSDNPHPVLKNPPTFEGIEAGGTAFALQLLLGNDCLEKTYFTDSDYESPMRETQIHPIMPSRKPNKQEQKCIDLIGKALKKGALVNADTYSPSEGHATVCLHGIFKRHAYSVLDLVKREFKDQKGILHPHYFVKLRDPHGKFGRDYRINGAGKLEAFSTEKIKDKGTGLFNVADLDDGTSYIEISDFVNEFDMFHIANVNSSEKEKEIRIANEEANIMKAYTDSFKEIRKYLKDGIPFFSKNSSEYNTMYDTLNDIVKKPAKNYLKLKNQLTKLKTALDEYLEHTDRVKGDPELRAVKKEACNAIELVFEAAKHGFMGPKTYAKMRIADRMMDNFMEQDAEGPDAKNIRKVKDKITNDRNDFRISVEHTPGFIEKTRNLTIVKMNQLTHAAFKNIKPEELDITLEKLKHVKVGDLRMNLPAMPKADELEYTSCFGTRDKMMINVSC